MIVDFSSKVGTNERRVDRFDPSEQPSVRGQFCNNMLDVVQPIMSRNFSAKGHPICRKLTAVERLM